jgi:c-di-GMP-related signal transduction protein
MKVPPRSGPAPVSPSIPVTRQPIFGSDLRIYGYELFFSPPQTDALIELADAELSRMAGGYPAFINTTRDFIVGGYCRALPSTRVVLEILEDVPPDPAVLDELAHLSGRGYRIALDDFVFQARQAPLIDLADIVKIDVLATSRDDLASLVRTLREYEVQLLAEKIETAEALDFARQLGFDYLQGYFLSRPNSSW